MSLRRRLLLGIVLMSAVGLVGVSLATNEMLRQSLVKQKDSQLLTLASGVERGGSRPTGRGGHPGLPTAAEGPTGYFQSAYAFDGTPLPSGPPSPSDTGGGLKSGYTVSLAKLDTPLTAPAELEGTYRILIRQYPTVRATDGTEHENAFVVSGLEMKDVDETVDRLKAKETVVIGIGLALMGLMTWLLVRGGLRPLNEMANTADAIAGGDLSARVGTTDERTEVGRLGGALNTMLGRIELAFAERTRSEDKLRRFVADASHELRTPLTSIRGYSELLRSGAIPAGDETKSALGRIESEATRMGVLVDDLLLLARLDQGRPLEFSRVELADLVHDAVSDARITDPDRTWSLTQPDSAVVIGDEHRLRQVVANLLTNARTHTPSGTPVDVTVGAVDGQIELVIADHGAGVPAGEEARIFERFARLDGSRQRASGGTGLGLAIVNAIVWTHGGSVGVRQTAGGGASFWMRLPSAVSDASAAPPWPAPSGS